MRRVWSTPLIALALAVGCADATLDLFPLPADAGEQNLAGEGGTGGTGGAGGGGSGAGGTAGMSAAAGTGNVGNGGRSDDEWCGGCPSPLYCATSSRRCVACRLPYECPSGEHGCEDDCGKGERCFLDQQGGSVPECARDCRDGPCPSSLPACDSNFVCHECNPTQGSLYQCSQGDHCNYAWHCVECTKNEECERSEPVCDWRVSQCRPCMNPAECNPTGATPNTPGYLVCTDEGLCEPPGQQPQP